MEREQFIKLITPALKEKGFKKIRSTWYKDGAECIAVFNVQASIYGPAYYINIGIYWKALGSLSNPKIYDCHLASGLLIDQGKEINVVYEAINWFEGNSTLDGIRETIKTNRNIKKELYGLINAA
jgi:hypothetical protein